jgi:class 3 adenylate cyclase/tetratricopeptide (TPR) repeat protein
VPTSNTCSQCGADNREGRRYCAGCGAALPRPCPQCGFSNEPNERFCGGCGADIGSEAAGRLPKTRGESSGQGERRQVTVLFADLSGYTALAAGRDPEETHGILRRFFEAVDSTVTKFGGAVERHIGDNVMGVFGAPIAHDDDPQRAVRAACEIHRAVSTISEEIGVALAVHVGIAAGTVMASNTGSSLKAAYGVVGSPVNLAARLQGTAAPGETLVSNAVRLATEQIVEFAAMGAVALKGLDAPVPVWRVKGERRETSAGGAVPLVGRRAEMRLLNSLLDGVLETGLGKTVYIRGEPGIGKTRLMQTIGELARARGFSCHVALVLDFGMGLGRDATRTLVAGMLGLTATSPEHDRRAAAASAVESMLAVADDAVFLADLLDVPQTPELRTLYDAMDEAARHRGRRRTVAHLIGSISAKQPLMLIVEDLHWADATTLENLAAIAEATNESRAVLAMTSRIDGDQLDEAWRVRVREGITTIDLGPLRPKEASELAERLRVANSRLLQQCLDRAQGNPLFLEQLLRNSEESAEADEVPASIQSLVLARMDRLPIADKEALQAAAVAGQRFSLDFVRALVRDATYVPTVLLRHQMIRPEGEEFLFAHALVRDGVYSSLTHERRRVLHRAAAEFYGDRDLVLKAEHLEQAHDPGAADAYRCAANAEATEYRYAAALSLADRGRAIAVGAADCFQLDALRGEYLREVGRARESLDAWGAALGGATDKVNRCRALIGMAAAHRILSRYEPALAALAEAQPLAETEGLTIELAQIHYYRGNLRFAQGDPDGCLAEHTLALAAGEKADDPEWRARASSGIGDALYSSCRMQSALDAFRSCVALCDAHGYGRVALPNRIMIGHCLIYRQQIGDAVAIIEEARKIASRAGNPHAEMFATQSIGVALVQGGQLEGAGESLADGLEQARALGARRYESNILSQRAECALHEGRSDEALQMISEAVAISREVGMGFTGPYALAVLARATDEPSARAAALAEGEAIVGQGSVGHNRVWYYRTAIETWIEARDWDEAERCVRKMRQATSAEPLPLVRFIAARAEALCAAGRGLHGPDLQRKIDDLIAEGTAKAHRSWLGALDMARRAVFGRHEL